ncbi:hypothetical protein Tco_0454805 [Tanacetum coccineum]
MLSEVTSVCDDLECNMPITTHLPTTDVREENVDIDLLLGEHLDTLSTGDKEIDFNPIRDIEELECLLANDPVPVPRVFNEPLGNSDSKLRSYDVTFSNPLFDFNDDYTLCNDNPLFDEEFEDISNLDPLESTPVIDESSLLVTPLPDPEQICLREVERFDPFFSLTQSGGTTMACWRPSSFGCLICHHPVLLHTHRRRTPYDLEDLRACFQSSNHAVSDHLHRFLLVKVRYKGLKTKQKWYEEDSGGTCVVHLLVYLKYSSLAAAVSPRSIYEAEAVTHVMRRSWVVVMEIMPIDQVLFDQLSSSHVHRAFYRAFDGAFEEKTMGFDKAFYGEKARGFDRAFYEAFEEKAGGFEEKVGERKRRIHPLGEYIITLYKNAKLRTRVTGDNKIDSLTKEPSHTLLMGDEVISTTPARENNEFIKSSVDDLVPIPRESEVTSVCDDLKCNMPITTHLPTTDVREEKLDIDLPLGEHLDTLSTRDREIDFNPSRDIEELERLLADDPVPVPRVFDEPLGHFDSTSRSFDVTFSNSLFDFNDDYNLS